ncbi:hypothetical protein quinque_008879 [Culex quinquefasciatus]
MLKNRLAQEQSGEAEIGLRYVIGPPEDEIATCTDRYELLKTLMTPDVDEERRNIVQDRLIHLGIRFVAVLRVSRGSPNLHGSLQNMVVELTSLLYAFYEEPPQEPEPPAVPNPPVPIPLKEYNNRRSLPVSRWDIPKYSGDDQGLRLNEFLETVYGHARAEHVSSQELFDSAIHLFTGSALKWYMTECSFGRLMNWDHLVFELRRTYMHPDLDALMRIKIYGRKQQKNESFHDYHNEVESMFRSMQYQLPEFEKIQILKQNMRTDYKKQLTFVPKQTLSILVNAARMLDAHSFPAYNKVFGLERNVHAESTTNQSNKKKQKESAGETVNAVGQPARPPQNQNNRNQQRTSTSTPQQQQQAGPAGTAMSLEVLGQIPIPFDFRGSTKVVTTLVVANLSVDCICGMDFWRKYRIHPTVNETNFENDPQMVTTIEPPPTGSILTEEEEQVIENIKKKFIPACEGQLTITPLAEHRIVLADEWKHKPPVRQFPYTMSPKTQELFAKSFVDGQLVYRRNMKQSNAAERYNAKYGPQFLPCRIKAKHGSSSYELEDLNGKNLGIWPAAHLKPG